MMDNYIKQLREALEAYHNLDKHFPCSDCAVSQAKGKGYCDIYYDLVGDADVLRDEVLSLPIPSSISRSSVPRADYDRLAEKCERLESWLEKIVSYNPYFLDEHGAVLRVWAIKALQGDKP